MQSTLPANGLISQGAGGPTDPSHDDDLRRGILRTDVSRPVAWLLVVSFLLAIVLVPLGQQYFERREDEESPLLELFRRAPTAENLRKIEHDLDEASYAKAFVQPRLQLLLTRLGRVGNKRALIGRDGYLYYTPGVLHVTGPGFLNTATQKGREKSALDAGEDAIVADPRPAILAFHRELARRGIRLVLMPLPDKAALQAEQLHGRGRPVVAPDNVDFDRFLTELREQGVAVFDARQVAQAGGTHPLYLQQDTHWTPDFMERVAQGLGRYVTQLGVLPAPERPSGLRAVAQPVARVGDIVDMLKLPQEQTAFLPQAVTVRAVQDAQGNAWEPDTSADVLLLGDSFTNIFSLEGMGWGAAAGLAPHLALALDRPLDVIAQNDSGAFAKRQAFAKEAAAGGERLQGKRVVIWEFASRELSVGDWKHIDWQHPGARKEPN